MTLTYKDEYLHVLTELHTHLKRDNRDVFFRLEIGLLVASLRHSVMRDLNMIVTMYYLWSYVFPDTKHFILFLEQ